MEVTFTQAPCRRYFMRVIRESGPELASRHGPGYHDFLPRDAVHFIVEAEAQLAGAVFGRLPDDISATVPDAEMARILARLDEFADRWSTLPAGESVVLTWPSGALSPASVPPPSRAAAAPRG